MKTLQLYSLALLLCTYVTATSQESRSTTNESFENVLIEAKQAYKDNQIKQSLLLSQQVVDQATELNDAHYAFQAHELLGTLYAHTENYDLAKSHAFKALEAAHHLNSNNLISRAYINLGKMFTENSSANQHEIALFEKQIVQLENSKNRNELFLVYKNLARAYLTNGNFKRAHKVLVSATKLTREFPVSQSDKANLSHLFGTYYQELEMFKRAEKHYLQVARLAEN